MDAPLPANSTRRSAPCFAQPDGGSGHRLWRPHPRRGLSRVLRQGARRGKCHPRRARGRPRAAPREHALCQSGALRPLRPHAALCRADCANGHPPRGGGMRRSLCQSQWAGHRHLAQCGRGGDRGGARGGMPGAQPHLYHRTDPAAPLYHPEVGRIGRRIYRLLARGCRDGLWAGGPLVGAFPAACTPSAHAPRRHPGGPHHPAGRPAAAHVAPVARRTAPAPRAGTDV